MFINKFYFLIFMLCLLVSFRLYATTYNDLPVTTLTVLSEDGDLFTGTANINSGGTLTINGNNADFSYRIYTNNGGVFNLNGMGHTFSTQELRVYSGGTFNISSTSSIFNGRLRLYSGSISTLGGDYNTFENIVDVYGTLSVAGNNNYFNDFLFSRGGNNFTVSGTNNKFSYISVYYNSNVSFGGMNHTISYLRLGEGTSTITNELTLTGDDHKINQMALYDRLIIQGSSYEIGLMILYHHLNITRSASVLLDGGGGHEIRALNMEGASDFTDTGSNNTYLNIDIRDASTVDILGNNNLLEDIFLDDTSVLTLSGNNNITSSSISLDADSKMIISGQSHTIKGILESGSTQGINVSGNNHIINADIIVQNNGVANFGDIVSSGYILSGDISVLNGGTLNIAGDNHLLQSTLNNAGTANITGIFDNNNITNTGVMNLTIDDGYLASVYNNGGTLTLMPNINNLSFNIPDLDMFLSVNSLEDTFIKIGNIDTNGGISNLILEEGALVVDRLAGDLTAIQVGEGGFLSIKQTGIGAQPTLVQVNDFNSAKATTVLHGDMLIKEYTSEGGLLVIDNRDHQSSLRIEKVVISNDDKIGYLFDISALFVGQSVELEFFTVENGAIVESIDDLLYKLYIGSSVLPKASSMVEFQLIDTLRGSSQSVIATITRESELENYDFNHKSVDLLSSVIDQLIIDSSELTKASDLEAVLTFLGVNNSFELIDSLLPVTQEVYLIDIHQSSGLLMNNLISMATTLPYNKQSREQSLSDGYDQFVYTGVNVGNAREDNELLLFVSPLYSYSSLSDEGDTIGYSGNEGLIQLGVGGYTNDIIKDIGIGLIGAVFGGYGEVSSNDEEVRSYDMQKLMLGGQMGVYIMGDVMSLMLSSGYTYHKYETNRVVSLFDVSSTAGLKLSNHSALSVAKPVVQEILFGADLSAQFEGMLSSDVIIPKIYYKAGIVMFEAYEENGSSGDLYVDKLDNAFVSDIGFTITSYNRLPFKGAGINFSLGAGYLYYDMKDTIYTFIEGKELGYIDALSGNNYLGAYVAPKVAISLNTAQLFIDISYLGNISFAGNSSHSTTLNVIFKI